MASLITADGGVMVKPCKTGYARCTSTGSCLSMSTTSNCNMCGNACKAPYSACDKDMGCVGKFTLPATFQLCTGIGAQTCAAPKFSAGYAEIILAKTNDTVLRNAEGNEIQSGLLTIWSSMGAKITAILAQNAATGNEIGLNLEVPEVSMKQHPKWGWVVEHKVAFTFVHVPRIRVFVTVEQQNGKKLSLQKDIENQSRLPEIPFEGPALGSRMCLY